MSALARRGLCPLTIGRGHRCDRLPCGRIVADETRGIERDFGFESGDPVAVAVGGFARVGLHHGLQGEVGKAQPSRTDFSRAADWQRQAADRQHVCRGTEVEVHIDAAVELRDFDIVVNPASSWTDAQLVMDNFIADDAIYGYRPRFPRRIALHRVLQ